MEKEKNSYLSLIIIHVILGIALYYVPFTSTLYSITAFIIGAFYIIINKNKNNEALHVSAYIVGAEVLMRMTNGIPFYEMGKYAVIIYMLLGIFFSSFVKFSAAN